MPTAPATVAAPPTGARSCSNCPSFVDGNMQRELIGTSLLAPICGIKMLPLIMPNQPFEAKTKSMQDQAANCGDFGKKVNFTPQPTSLQKLPVGWDVASVDVSRPTSDQTNARCSDCSYNIPAEEVREKTGFIGSICKISGNLMPTDRLGAYAKSCHSYNKRYGPKPSEYFSSFTFSTWFDANYGKVDWMAIHRKRLESGYDPRNHVSDAPVTDAQRERGIMAWHKITDPEGYGADVMLPVFNPHFFSPEEQKLIPRTGDDTTPEEYLDHGQLTYMQAAMWQMLDETPAWWGEGGTGKTEFARYLAWLMGLPFHRININGSSEIDTIIGKMRFENGETVFQPGRLSKAWSKPGVILLDEPNTGPPDIWQILRSLLDNSRELFVDLDRGDGILRGKNTYLSMAMNPSWDPRNVGTNTLGDADMSRLTHIYFGQMPEEIEMEVIRTRVRRRDGWVIDDAMMKAIMKTAADLRAASLSGTLQSSWNLRHQIKVARLLRYMPPAVAYRRAVSDGLEPSQHECVMTAVNSHFTSRTVNSFNII